MDDFIETGSGGGIGFGLCEDITHAVIDEEKMTSLRKYHTITEAKNGAGATPIKTEKGWIHIAHGVRNTAAGLRYVIYAFATDLKDPSKVIAEPSGLLIGPRGEERAGDVSNVVFTNGAIVNEKNEVFIYYASSDTRMHVATTTVEKLENKLTLKELASHFGYSESYMYRLFFKETGYAPMNYFLHMKIDRACQLLLHTNMKINQVALKLGFDDPYYFSRIFKKIVGTSPKDYRHSLPK